MILLFPLQTDGRHVAHVDTTEHPSVTASYAPPPARWRARVYAPQARGARVSLPSGPDAANDRSQARSEPVTKGTPAEDVGFRPW